MTWLIFAALAVGAGCLVAHVIGGTVAAIRDYDEDEGHNVVAEAEQIVRASL